MPLPRLEPAGAQNHDIVRGRRQDRRRCSGSGRVRTLGNGHGRMDDGDRHTWLQRAALRDVQTLFAITRSAGRSRRPALDERAAVGAVVLPPHGRHARSARDWREDRVRPRRVTDDGFRPDARSTRAKPGPRPDDRRRPAEPHVAERVRRPRRWPRARLRAGPAPPRRTSPPSPASPPAPAPS